jgi:two-component system, sensor histidine kinase PdtaS
MKNLLYCFLLVFFIFFVSCKNNRKDYAIKNLPNPTLSDTASINSGIRDVIKLVRSNPDSVIARLNNILNQSRSVKYINGTGEAYWLMGLANFYKYRYDTALHFYTRAYSSYNEIGNKQGMAKAQFSMSYAYSAMQNMKKSLESAESAKKFYEAVNDFNKVYDCIEGLMYINKQLNKTKDVDSLMNMLIAVAEKTRDKKKLAGSFITLGNHYIDQAYLNLAIEAFYKALSMVEKSGDSTETADALGCIGLANLYLHQYHTAIDYYLQQEEILVSRNDNYELSKTYTGLGEAYNSLNDYPKGLKYHLKSLALSKKMNFIPSISNSLQNIGYTYYLMKDNVELALDYVNQSIKINTEIRNSNKLADNYLLSGRIYMFIRNYPKATWFLERCLALAQQFNNPNVIMDASGLLSKLYAERRNFEKAYTNMLINNEISDSLISGNNLRRITQLEMQRSFDKKENESEVRHLQEKLKFETELRKNRLIRNYLLIVGTLIIGFGIFLFYSFKKSQKADKEKEALLKEIHHRVKNNLMVISSLLNLQSGTITDDNTRTAVRESQNRVKSMALIHQLLYQSEMYTGIDFSQYLEQLMQFLQSTYSKPGRNIHYTIRADRIRLDIDTAIPLGLITNELTTNAYKYAFIDNRDGKIEIDFHKTMDHKYLLRVSDNGKGLPEGIDPEESSTLGLKLVKILTKQIKGKLNYSKHNGTEFNVVFSISP